MPDSTTPPGPSSAPRTEPRLGRALRLRCPLCGEGRIFRGWFRLEERCSGCGWRFEREPGYFLGSIYINYGASTALIFLTWAMLAWGLDLPLLAAVLGTALVTVLFPLWFLRYARAFWIWFDLQFDREEDRDGS